MPVICLEGASAVGKKEVKYLQRAMEIGISSKGGSVGSGKSTLARSLSKKLQIPHYELDNVVWRRTENGDVRNSPEVRDNMLQKNRSQRCLGYWRRPL